ncbi:MAG: hypothetical protein HY912_24275 [Desulfomonile tiedjei]|uniref:Uncharacterized protein n=1 Tax=Desulfomonile tiedjei TaxID=2358 RepID=A0A9D6V8N7_9BACT|nr:hypothetical protein [Desulfomonile tiedjei]
MRSTLAWIVVLASFLFSAEAARAVTCDDCKEIHKNKQGIQQELLQKDAELNVAFKSKNFQQVNDLRTRMLELRKKMNELRSSDEKCEQACKPDVVKATECKKLLDEILRAEAVDSVTDDNRIDALYREFRSCNNEMVKLKQAD